MKRLSRTAALAAGLAAALLMSTSLASAAEPGHRNTQQTRVYHDNDHGPSKSDARKARHNDRRDARNRQAFRHRAHRVTYPAYDRARYRDRFHRPPPIMERVRFAPYPGSMRWRAGHWRWHDGQWAWIVGTWLIAAQAMHR